MESFFSNPTNIAVAAGGFFAVAALTIVVVIQQRRITHLQELTRPRYGFLGKPLLSVALALAMVGGLVITYQATRNIDNVVVNADKNVEIRFQIQTTPVLPTSYKVDFAIVPSVDGVEWGKESADQFDIYWSVTGAESFENLELGKSRANVSGFTRFLNSGRYDITVDVVYANKRFTKTQVLALP